jgi:hypothetical protein
VLKGCRWKAAEIVWRGAAVEPDILEVWLEDFEQPEGEWEQEEEDGKVVLMRTVEESDGF